LGVFEGRTGRSKPELEVGMEGWIHATKAHFQKFQLMVDLEIREDVIQGICPNLQHVAK
jgi:hypothetical protein